MLKFLPLEADPLSGTWSAVTLTHSQIQLPAFSQVILIDPATCPNCLAVAGDYDGNGQVNLQDYNTWRLAYGSAAAAADGNHNGIVDAADYVVWGKQFAGVGSGSGISALTAAIPEPGSLVLVVLATATAVAAVRRIEAR